MTDINKEFLERKGEIKSTILNLIEEGLGYREDFQDFLFFLEYEDYDYKSLSEIIEKELEIATENNLDYEIIESMAEELSTLVSKDKGECICWARCYCECGCIWAEHDPNEVCYCC